MPHRLLSLEHFRTRLAHVDALPQLVVLGVLSGLVAGGLISLFRGAYNLLQYWLLSGGTENFESLPEISRLLFPVVGSLLLILLYLSIPAHARSVGIVHLLERLNNHQGRMPGGNMLVQLLAALIALASGHSVGREGPAVHMGAASSSWLGQRLNLPNNTLRLLVGCGAAAGISAAFNTPLAGVIFAMEVILLEYTLVGFLPIMVAAVVGDVVVRLTVGEAIVFNAPALQIHGLSELPLVMLLGLMTGLLAAGFHFLHRHTFRICQWSIATRFLLAGTLTGLVAMHWPEVMGSGYDTIEALFHTQPAAIWLLGLLLAKWLLTPVIIALGIPAGLIAPSLFIGASAGALLGATANSLGLTTDTALYAMLGMGAMMAALLNAPLAALLAMLELTHNTAIILPGMLAIVIANLTTRYGFGLPSIFHASLQAQGMDLRQAPLTQVLSRAAVGSLMQRNFAETESIISLSSARDLLTAAPQWLLVQKGDNSFLLPPADLKVWLENEAADATDPELSINLLEIPAQRRDVMPLLYRSTLKEALDLMLQHQLDYLLVVSNQESPLGLISKEQIESYYNHKQSL
ncbi:chloride channel protein [Marinobacterium sp. MBR-109]|jgi:CIC family chloride channel protein|uniref:chloride channel protein n=1 Tax=Marinobacterium sp. MBR-109 TaxID=3156462 RepID=UPI003398E748